MIQVKQSSKVSEMSQLVEKLGYVLSLRVEL